MIWVLLCISIFIGYFILRFGMVNRGRSRSYIQFTGGLLLLVSLVTSFFLIGWVKGLINIAIFWIVITPIVEIIIQRIDKRINAPYEEIHMRIAEKYDTTSEDVKKKIHQ